MGNVTAGEIGALKKEILYTGDVINTAARIQSLCNELNESLLLSDELIEVLNMRTHSIEKGSYVLRGKDQKVRIHTVHEEALKKLLN